MISQVTYRDLLDDPACDALLAEYAAECASPEYGEHEPDDELYALLESSGGLQCFAVRDESLIGFACVLIHGLPHFKGRKIATTESVFISKPRRTGKIWRELRSAIEGHGRDKGCVAFVYTAPTIGRFSQLLAMDADCRHSGNVFVRKLC